MTIYHKKETVSHTGPPFRYPQCKHLNQKDILLGEDGSDAD